LQVLGRQRSRKLWFEVRTGKISQTPSSTKKLDLVAHTCYSSYVENVIKRIAVQAGLGKSMRLSKNNNNNNNNNN
jgi:hypothetical protein